MSNTKKELREMNLSERAQVRDEAAKAINAKLRELGKREFSDSRIKSNVGGNGFQPGDTFTLTGDVALGEIQGSDNAFLAITTTTGEMLSLKCLIPQSVAGYETDSTKTFYDEFKKDSEDAEMHKPTFEAPKGFKKITDIVDHNKTILNHGTKSDFELYGLISEKYWSCKGLQLTYCGKVYRQTTARKDYDFGENHVSAGARRAMSVSVWLITEPTK